MFRNGSMQIFNQLLNDVRGTHGRHNGVRCSKRRKKRGRIAIRHTVYLRLWT